MRHMMNVTRQLIRYNTIRNETVFIYLKRMTAFIFVFLIVFNFVPPAYVVMYPDKKLWRILYILLRVDILSVY